MNTIRAEHEARIGLEPVEVLTARRHALVVQNAPRRARYAFQGTWKERRDRLHALIAVEVRRKLGETGEKVTEPMVKEAVLLDPRMEKYLDAVEREMAAFHIAEDEITAINDILLRDAAIARHISNELRLS